MRTIFKNRQEYYKAVEKQKELAEELKESKFKDTINQTLKKAMEVEATQVKPEVSVETDIPVEEKKKPGRKKA